MKRFTFALLVFAGLILGVYAIGKISYSISAGSLSEEKQQVPASDFVYLSEGKSVQAVFTPFDQGDYPRECQVRCGRFSGQLLFSTERGGS